MLQKIFGRLVCFVLSFGCFTSQANVLGNMQTLSPTPDSLYFQNIHSSKTLGKNYFNIGFFSAFVKDQISAYSNMTTQQFANYKDQSVTYDLILAWGVTEHFELFYAQPGFIDQKPDSNQTQQNNISKGVNTHRPGFKYDFSKNAAGGFALAASVDIPVTVDDPYVGTSPKPIYNLEAIYDIRGKSHAIGFNLGYRKRTPGELPVGAYFYPLKDQWIYSAGYVYGLRQNYRLHLELYGATAADKTPHLESKNVSALEGLLGAKFRLAKNFWLHAGATAELLSESLSPAYRIYGGFNYFFGFEDKVQNEEAPSAQEKRLARNSLQVLPPRVEMAPQDSVAFTVSGGAAPYSYRLASPFGTFDETSLKYFAPTSPGQNELIVEDANGSAVSIPIVVVAPTTSAPQQPPSLAPALAVFPASLDMLEASAQKIDVSGGQPPYRYRLADPFGRFDESALIYYAPTRAGQTELIVEDGSGAVARVPIVVKELPKATQDLVIKNLEFVFNTAKLTSRSEGFLNNNIEQLRALQVEKILVLGHTDNVGSADYNQRLSLSRAQTVADYLTQRLNLQSGQIQAIGYGMDRPIASNDTDSGRQTNRRVELKLYYKK